MTNEAPLMEAAVCADHRAKLESGAPWDLDGVKNELRMESSLPPVVTGFEISSSMGPGVTMKLDLEGYEQPVQVWITREHLSKLVKSFSFETEDV
ncbi:hypothetical protein [Arthrobacter sp. 92]|uniref:hypothetical protein n=1 Tax=Arthrobacter sp. 92 TaxID=3418175 RepID=UPI003D06F9D0